MKIRPLSFLKWFCFFLWSLLTLGYFFYRFPIRNLLEILLSGATLFILVCWFIVVGHRALQAFHIEYASFSEEISLSFGVGTGCAIFVVFSMATLHLLYEPLIVALILLVGGILYRDAKTLLTRGCALVRNYQSQTHSLRDWVLIVLLSVTTLLTFVGAATPTFFFDALYYHLAVPHKYLLQHGFHKIPYQDYSNVPLNMGMLFILAMSFSKTILPQLFSWFFTPMTAVTVYAFGRRYFERRVALLAAAIFFLIPGVLISSTLTSVEGGVMYYTILSLYAFFRYTESSSRLWLSCSALFCSLATGTKYTAIATTLPGMLLLVILHELLVRKCGCKNIIITSSLFILLVTVGMLPWLMKNVIYTGNPTYPFFQSIFQQDIPRYTNYAHTIRQGGNPLQTEIHNAVQMKISCWQSTMNVVKIVLTSPWTFTMKITGAAGKPGALFLLCLPGLFLLPPLEKSLVYLIGFSMCAFGGWMLLLPWLQRFAYPIFPPLSIVVAYIVLRLPLKVSLRKIFLSSIAFILLYQLTLFLSEETNLLRSFDFLLNNQTTEEFLVSHGVNYYPAIQHINSHTPITANILFVGEARGYYIQRDYVLHTPIDGLDQGQIPLRSMIIASPNISALMEMFRQQNISHILVNNSEIERLSKAYLQGRSYFGLTKQKDWDMLQALFSSQYSHIVFSRYDVDVYEFLEFQE